MLVYYFKILLNLLYSNWSNCCYIEFPILDTGQCMEEGGGGGDVMMHCHNYGKVKLLFVLNAHLLYILVVLKTTSKLLVVLNAHLCSFSRIECLPLHFWSYWMSTSSLLVVLNAQLCTFGRIECPPLHVWSYWMPTSSLLVVLNAHLCTFPLSSTEIIKTASHLLYQNS